MFAKLSDLSMVFAGEIPIRMGPQESSGPAGEEIQMALGAVEVQQSTGCSRCSHCRVLYGQIFRDGKWCPVKLTETEPDLWPLDWFELTLWDLYGFVLFFGGIWKN